LDGWIRVIGNSKREINVAAPVLTFGAILTFVFGLFLSLFQRPAIENGTMIRLMKTLAT
jgi:hypothetical protein